VSQDYFSGTTSSEVSSTTIFGSHHERLNFEQAFFQETYIAILFAGRILSVARYFGEVAGSSRERGFLA
jgi:hypothetical protein